MSDTPASSGRGATWVAAGILCSRLVGFLRERVLAHAFGLGPFADVFSFALRGPNFLQNLLGEGTLSAAFIPVYSRLRKEGREEDARRFAGAIFGLLCAVAGAIALLGFLAARPLAAILVPGYLADAAKGAEVDRFALAVRAIRFMFPMTGFLVLSAWCLGVLNSHRRFFVGYVAPVLWNLAILSAVVFALRRSFDLESVLFAACAGALVGGFLQFASQLPMVIRLVGGLRPSLSRSVAGVREALGAVGPAIAGRGAVQITSYLDFWLASFLALGAQAALRTSSMFYLLPVSLFGMSVAAAELPDLARLGQQGPEAWRGRLDAGLRKMAFLNVPAAVAFLVLGDVVVAAVMQTGAFGSVETRLTSWVLAAAAVGLVAATSSRLLVNVFYARGRAGIPSRIAFWRLGVWLLAAVPLMLLLDRLAPAAGSELRCGAVGLAAAGTLASWVELGLLLRAIRRELIPDFSPPWGSWARMLLAAGGAAAASCALAFVLRHLGPIPRAAAVLPSFAAVYWMLCRFLKVDETSAWLGRRLR